MIAVPVWYVVALSVFAGLGLFVVVFAAAEVVGRVLRAREARREYRRRVREIVDRYSKEGAA